MMDVVNKDNFSKFSQMHKLREEGKDDEANKIREELGLHGRGHGDMRGEHRGGHLEDKNGDGVCDHLDNK